MPKLSFIAHEVALWSFLVLCMAGLATLAYGVATAETWALVTGIWVYSVGMLLWLTAHVATSLSAMIGIIRRRNTEALRKNPGQLVLPAFGAMLLLCFGVRLAWSVIQALGIVP